MVGLLCSWLLELHYIFVSMVMAFFSTDYHIREIVATAKLLEFVLVPILQEPNTTKTFFALTAIAIGIFRLGQWLWLSW